MVLLDGDIEEKKSGDLRFFAEQIKKGFLRQSNRYVSHRIYQLIVMDAYTVHIGKE